MSAIRPNDLSKQAIFFRRFKTGTKRYRVQPPPIVARWAVWLAGWGRRREGGGEYACLFGPGQLNATIAELLASSAMSEHRWHAWRRGGAFVLSCLGVRWELLALFGGWESLGQARAYATPSTPLVFEPEWCLPLPPTKGLELTFVSRKISSLYPPELFILLEKVIGHFWLQE